MIRRLVYLSSLGILALALTFVPVPVLVLEPGPALEVTGSGTSPGVIEVEGVDGAVNGQYLLTAVRATPQPIVPAVQAAFTETEVVLPFGAAVPQGVDPDEYQQFQRELFRESMRAAGAVGARAAGLEVTISGDGARVAQIIEGAPATEALQQGDVIVGVEGESVELASQLVSALEGRQVGETVRLRIRRGDEQLEETVTLGPLPGSDQAGLGVIASTLNLTIDTPIEVSPDRDVAIGGPSAGLMFALSVYDVLADEDLLGGRTVAGTGTIDLDGNVGPVSGVPAKVAAAEREGADVFLVPAELAEEARAVAADSVEVVAVETLDDAIAALQS